MGVSWPLVGRQRELELATAHCRAGGVLLCGPSGVGKTRLASEVVASMAPVRSVHVRATGASSGMPLGAFAQVLAASGAVTGDASGLGSAARQLIGELGPDEHLVVSVDDVQLLDDVSATLLLHLAMSDRVRLVLTLRTGERAPDAVTLLWRDELVARMDMEPLGPEEIRELLELALPGGIDGFALSTLITASAGNLLYLRELVTGLTASGVLDDRRGHWELTGPVTAPTPLAELVQERLATLSRPARRLLDAVALGEPLGVSMVDRERWQIVQELIDAGMVEHVETGRRNQLRAAHPLHAEIARSTMAEPDRLETLGSLADAIERVGCRRRDDARRLASWRLDAGGPADPEVLVEAAHEASLGADPATCERFARAALDADDVAVDLRLAAAHLLGRALDDLGRFEEAESIMARHEPGAGTGRSRTMLALKRSGNLFRGLGRHEDALRLVEAAEAAVRSPALQRELVAQRGWFAVYSGQIETALEVVAPLLDRGDQRSFAEAALAASVAHTLAGRPMTAIGLLDDALEVRVGLGDQVQLASPGMYLVALAMARADAGQLHDAHRTALEGYRHAVALGDRHGQAWMSVMLSRVELLLGRLADAAQHAREAALVFGELGHPGTRWGFALLAAAAAQRDDAPTAVTALEDLDAEPATPMAMMDVELDRARAWTLIASGHRSAAVEVLGAAAATARSWGQASLEVGALHDLARVGDAGAVAPRLRELVPVVEGELMAARAAHVEALLAGDAEALDDVAGVFSAMGADLLAAESWMAAARAHRRVDEQRRGSASEQLALGAMERCQGAATPALLVTAAVEPLTRREREVAGLAARGHTSREIADDLIVSVRTVENHLQRAYSKLGVTSREELAEIWVATLITPVR